MLLQDLAVVTHGSHSDLVRACGRMLLSSMLYSVQNGCGRRLIGGGASDFGGRCRSFGRGMWDGKGGGWCGWGVDYLTISTRPLSKKKGRRRGGRTARRRVAGEEAALQEEGSPMRRRCCKKKGSRRGGSATRRRVAGEEAELPVSSSEGLNLESKEEQWKCGFGRRKGMGR